MSAAAEYAAAALEADRDLAEAGAALTFTRSSGDRDPITGQAGGTPTSWTAPTVVLKGRVPFGTSPEGARAILQSSRELLVSPVSTPAGTVPQVGDHVTIDGDDYTIEGAYNLAPDGSTSVLWTCEARK